MHALRVALFLATVPPLVTACGDATHRAATASVRTGTRGVHGAASSLPPKRARRPLVRWRGPVEHLFFHPLVADPARAFHGFDGRGFRDYFVTVIEFRRILDQLYANGYELVDIHAAVSGRLRVERGRKPLVLSVDDLNYYDYLRAAGPAWRLRLDAAGRVAVELRDPLGHHPRLSRTDEIVPLVDDFVTAHPAFSLGGAKGVIAETGYEGVFGERTNERSAPDLRQRVARARRIAHALTSTGWTLASHSWGHLDLSRRSTAAVLADAERWRRQVQPIVGATDVYAYPFGAVPSVATRRALHTRYGFRIFCSIDVVPGTIRADGVVTMYRRHVDGLAFAGQRRNLSPLFAVGRVIDEAARW